MQAEVHDHNPHSPAMSKPPLILGGLTNVNADPQNNMDCATTGGKHLLVAEVTAEVVVIVCRADNSIVVAPPVVLVNQHRRPLRRIENVMLMFAQERV